MHSLYFPHEPLHLPPHLPMNLSLPHTCPVTHPCSHSYHSFILHPATFSPHINPSSDLTEEPSSP